MINVNDFKTGVTIKLDNNIFQVLDFQHVKPGKGSAFVRTKLKNLRTGATIDHTFNAGIKVEKAHIDKSKMQYLYDEADSLVFMDNETYDQLAIPKKQVKWAMNFLKENAIAEVTRYEGEILGVALPNSVVLKVVETEPGIKGDTATNATKIATLETGFEVRVPLFIEEGEDLIINTGDGKYIFSCLGGRKHGKIFEVEQETNDHACISKDVLVDIIRAVIMENRHLFIDNKSYLKLKNSKFVSVINNKNRAIINLDLNYNFGKNINEVSKKLQLEIEKMIRHLTGIEIEEINIHIIGIDM